MSSQYKGDARLAKLKRRQQDFQPVEQTSDARVASSVSAKAAVFQTQADAHSASQAINPFSAQYKPPNYVTLRKDDPSYGRPPEGSKTELRGKQAGVHISSEVVELCRVIKELGQRQEDGTHAITFGPLFEMYTRISNKLVGMLMRARRQGLVAFEGEMLFQRRDDNVVIWLVNEPEALMEDIHRRKEDLATHPKKH